MIEIVIHGRGGQGAVTAAKIIASAALKDGKFTTYRPGFFAAERQGAPVKAFVRISNDKICLRHKIEKADGIIVLDPSLWELEVIDFKAELKKSGWAVINTNKICGYLLGLFTLDATNIAIRNGLGSKIVNTAILGVLAAPKFSIVSLQSLERAVRELSPRKINENLLALRESFKIAGGQG